jgi:hypothetical protein
LFRDTGNARNSRAFYIMAQNNDWLYIALGGAVLVYLWSKTDNGQSIINVIGDDMSGIGSAIRGIRNNNPGNIRLSAEKWQGLSDAQTDSSFFQFVSMDYGVRAMARILVNYSDKYGLNTVRSIISRWAPPTENNTDAYINAVAGSIGVGPDEPIDVHDSNTLFQLIRAVITHENGAAGAFLVSDAAVSNGISLAGV